MAHYLSFEWQRYVLVDIFKLVKLYTCNGFVSFACVNGHTATQINVGKHNKLSSISVFKRRSVDVCIGENSYILNYSCASFFLLGRGFASLFIGQHRR